MKIALLDHDEENSKKIEKWLIERFGESDIWCYNTPFSFVTGIYDDRAGDFDLMFIRATEETIEMASDVQNFFPHIFAIFYSEDVKMADYSFNASPLFFLSLPIQMDRLESAMKKARETIESYSGDSITLTTKGKMVRIKTSSIKYIESEGRKLLVYSDDGYFETNMTMDDIQALLSEHFIRCHRSYIVNSRKINRIEANDIILSSKEIVPVSRSHISMIKKSIV